MNSTARLTTALLSGLAFTAPLSAQEAGTSWTTESQISQGGATYAQQCATCHGNEMISALTGYPTASSFYQFVSQTMPLNNPGGLPAQSYADIVAYLLHENGYPVGDTPLPADIAVLDTINPSNIEAVAQAPEAEAPAEDAEGEPEDEAEVEAPDEDAVPDAVEEEAEPAAPLDAAPDAVEEAPVVEEPVVPEEPEIVLPDRDYRPVTSEMLLDPDAGDWLHWRRTVDSHGHSPLDQINRETVGDLELAWAWALGEGGQQEVVPIIHDGIMFLATNNNYVEALDAVTGDRIWAYTHVRPEFEGGYHNNQALRQKNSVALWDDKVILTTVDARLIALEALSGQVVWDVEVADWADGYSYTSGPLVADGKIFTGLSGCSIVDTNGACWITAHDADTGEELWRFNTLDDPNNPAVDESWQGVPVENRWGATPWATASYDPELNTVFWGTGMPIPYAEISRGSGDGDVLYTNSTLALDADTGELKWYYQHLPRDNWDLDSPFERIIVETEIDGEPRKLIVTTPGKNGVTFGLDAETGEFIWGETTVYTNTITGIDPETGRVQTNEEIIFTEFGEQHTFCPAIPGGRLWQATAYSPDTGLFYLPAANVCQTSAARPFEIVDTGTAVAMFQSFGQSLAPGFDNVGALHVLDAATGAAAFDIQQGPRFTSSILATSGGLIFVGDADRYVYALNDETGEEIWRQRLQAPIGGTPVTYEVEGVQYLVIAAGTSNQTHPALTPGLQVPRQGGNAVFVFRLPE